MVSRLHVRLTTAFWSQVKEATINRSDRKPALLPMVAMAVLL
jgi:hypothetical protein